MDVKFSNDFFNIVEFQIYNYLKDHVEIVHFLDFFDNFFDNHFHLIENVVNVMFYVFDNLMVFFDYININLGHLVLIEDDNDEYFFLDSNKINFFDSTIHLYDWYVVVPNYVVLVFMFFLIHFFYQVLKRYFYVTFHLFYSYYFSIISKIDC